MSREPATSRVRPGRRLAAAVGGCVIGLVWVYRATLGPLLGGHCRFHPSCSQYMIEAVRKHGPRRGLGMGLRRIGRCHPFSEGGVDEP